MDRNPLFVCPSVHESEVALRKESVDRNFIWPVAYDATGHVALRKESVDRNYTDTAVIVLRSESLSARRAWIEIYALCISVLIMPVALRKESVDRNHQASPASLLRLRCRSPQGERG